MNTKAILTGFALLIGYLAILGGVAVGKVQSVAHNTKIQVYFLGIPVGKLKLYYATKKGSYTLSAFAETSGISRLISDAKAKMKSNGSNVGGNLRVGKHWVDYVEGSYHVTRTLNFRNGNVANVASKPPIKIRTNRVPLLPKHALGVVDIASSSFFSVTPQQIENGAAICNRTLRIHDGESRLNVRLQFKSTRIVSVRGFKGKAYNCAARYEPIAGHEPGKKIIDYMASNRDMELTMARIGTTSVYGMIHFNVATPVGRITGTAYKFLTELR